MINAVSSTPSNNTQPQSPMGAGPMPATPMMPAAPSVTEHPVTQAMPATPVTTTTTTTTTPLSPAGAPAFPAARPDLRENKTSLDLEKSTVDSFSTGSGNGAGAAGQAPKKKTNIGIIAGVIALLVLVVGGGVGLYLSQQNADVRQQASGGNTSAACGSTCTTNLDCPAANTCSAGKCALTACLASGAICNSTKCAIGEPNANACSVSFNATTNNSISCSKVSYQDEFSNSAGVYTLSTQKSTFSPGDVVVFKVNTTNNGQGPVTISLTDVLSESGTNNLGKVTFMDSDCGANAYDSNSKTLTCSANSVAVGASVAHIFRVKLDASIADGTNITNVVQASVDANTTTSCTATVAISNPTTTTYSCNSSCSSDAQCQTANGDFVCSNNQCRLGSNTSSETCSPPQTTTYACNSGCSTDAQCQTANSNYVCSNSVCRLSSNTSSETCAPPGTATYTCNSSCTTDAQCQTANASYVCDANNGNTCRMDSNRGDTSCQPPANTYACNSSCDTDAQCQSANANYVCNSNQCRLNSNVSAENCQPSIPVVVTPAVGCNQTCVTNSDCAASNQICSQTDSGLKCRLDNYVNSETCTTPGTTSVPPTAPGVTPTPAVIAQQPEKPATLPKTGSAETTVRFLIMGAGAVVLGALGLLLL